MQANDQTVGEARQVIRLGIIGLGRFSRYHLICLSQQIDVKLIAVADLNKDQVNEVVEQWNCKGYLDWNAMLDNESMDAVIVLTPEMYHVEPVLKALSKGCHVFVEKPLALEHEEAAKLVQTAEQANRLLMVGHVGRFDTRLLKMKRAITEGRLGPLRSIYARRNNPKKYFSIYRRSNPIYILGIHDIDLMHWMTGSRVVEVFARSSSSSDSEHDLIWSMLKYANGTIGVIENNWLMPDNTPAEMDIRMEIVGDSGTIHFQEPDRSLEFWVDDAITAPASYSWNEVYGQYYGDLHNEMNHFYACIRQNKPSSILNPYDALEAVKVAEAIVQSSKTGLPIQLS
ncbi:Gfo/Idh/MocA family protein [Paenibacillus chungangensis]|uniref:Gfo/Idh/MocA family protein n=1 Tax=Paenibacillus chungangensis TaxID=696535 RepID=A0ABW3HU67_9BACL